MAALLAGLVSRKAKRWMTGGTWCRQTTMLKAMLMRCPPNEAHRHRRGSAQLGHDPTCQPRVSGHTRSQHGRCRRYRPSELICATLRMRPDRVVVGEYRGGEVVDSLRALNSGMRRHDHITPIPNWRRFRRRLSIGFAGQLEPRATAAPRRDAFDVVLHVERLALADGALRRSAGGSGGRSDCMGVCWPPGWPYGPCQPTRWDGFMSRWGTLDA